MKKLLFIFCTFFILTSSHPWEGRKVAFLGDSITDQTVLSDDVHYWGYLQQWLDINAYVYGISGHQWTDVLGQAAKLNKEHGNDIDAIMIFLGTNDYNMGVPLGEWFLEDMQPTNANGKDVLRKHRTLIFDQNTFRGRINYALDSLKRMYPTKQIVLMTPIHRGPAKFSEDNVQPSEEFCNSCGEYIDVYVQALKEASGIWSVPVIDMYSLCGILPSRSEHAIYVPGGDDYLHPNQEGHRRMALCLYYQLNAIPCQL